MAAVLRRITNAPVHLPPEALTKHQPRRKTGHSFLTHWCSWGYNLYRHQYQTVSARALNDTRDGDTITFVDKDANNTSDGDVEVRLFDNGGMARVICPQGDATFRRSTAVLIVVWFTISYGTYGVATWNNQLFADIGLSNPYLCSFIFAISNLPGNVGSILLVERVRGHEICEKVSL